MGRRIRPYEAEGDDGILVEVIGSILDLGGVATLEAIGMRLGGWTHSKILGVAGRLLHMGRIAEQYDDWGRVCYEVVR